MYKFFKKKVGFILYKLRVFILALKFYIFNSFITNFPSYDVRTIYLKKVLKIKIGRKTAIHMGCFFAGSKVHIGNNTVINRNCYFDGRNGNIYIGNNVSVSPESYFLTDTHLKDSAEFKHIFFDVVINDYSWIGARGIVLPGVVMGRGSVLGAGSTATRNVPDYSVYAGIPAKFISKRSENLIYELSYFPYFNTDIE